MIKKITAVAIAVLVATQANATEVYKNEKVSLDLNGRAYAGHFFGNLPVVRKNFTMLIRV